MSEVVDCISWIVRKTCWSLYVFLKFLLLRLLDFLGLIFNVAACLTIIRFPMMLRQFKDMEDLEEWRYIGFLQLLIFILDIPVMIAGVILVLTVFRMFPLCKELQEENCKWDFHEKQDEIYYGGCKPRQIILKHFGLLFIDALFIPAALLCLLSWRCVIFVREFKKASQPWEKRKTCFKQLLYLFLDIPCIVLGLICLCSWRLPFIIHRWHKIHSSRTETWEWDEEKWYAFYHAGLLLVDIPCIIFFVLSCLTWRIPFLVRKLSTISLFADGGEQKLRKLAVAQFLLIFVDIPCICCSCFIFVTVWRFPFFLQDVKSALRKKKGRQWKIRKSCILQFCMLFVDIGCFILALLIFLTLWRIPPLLRAIKKASTPKHQKLSEVDEEKDGEDKAGEDVMLETDRETLEVVGKDITQVTNADPLEAVSDTEDGPSDRPGDETADVSKNEGNHDDSEQQEEGRLPVRDCQEEQDSKNREKKSKIGWKIRKAICMQFVGLLLDLPAFGLLLLLIVTIVRVPKVLSTFLQSGDIYTEFAITIYYQTYILFIDIVFAVLFLILIFLRPIQAWICLLEDEEHMKYRLLCHHLQWIPDIVSKRANVYQRADELLSVNLKMFSLPFHFSESVRRQLSDYCDELRTVRDVIKENEIDPDYVHLLDSVLWWEGKRACKILRCYQSEYNYLLRPDIQVHKENQERLKRELEAYEAKVDEQYFHLEQFSPNKVPLWTVSTGLSTRTRKETQKVLINCLPHGTAFLMILAILFCLPLYRAPGLIVALWKRWYDKSNIILSTMREYGLDLVTILRIILVIVFIYRAPFLLADISIDVIDKRSWKAVRKTAKKYPAYIWEDFINIIKTLLSWKTPRFIFTASLFGILMPADIFMTAAKILTKRTCLVYLITGTLYIVFVGFPFVFSFYLGKKLLQIGMGWVSAGACCGFVGAFILALALIVAAFVKKSKDIELVPRALDYFHWNWYNMHVIIMELLEFLQLIALAFSYSGIPMYGGNVLHEASNYLLLSFFSFDFKFWLAFALFVVWFFFSAAPVIFEQILEDLPKGTCEKHSGWRMAISVFANTLFITLFECFASCFSCSYTKCPPGINYKLLPSNESCFQANLTDQSSISCWTGQHRLIALFGLLGLVWYTSTSFLVAIQYGDPGIKKQDVAFSPTYNVISNFVKAVMIVAVVVITTNKHAVLGILIGGNLLMILFTLLFKTVFHFKPTNSRSFITWRIASFSSSMFAAIAVIVAYVMNIKDNKIPLLIFGVGTLVSVLSSAIASFKLRRKGLLSETRTKFKDRLFALEKRLFKENMLLSSWKDQRAAWKHLLGGVREARRDDQIFRQADWETLLPKETEPENTIASEGAASNDEAQTEIHEAQPTPQQLNDAMLPPYLPPPPSYGSMAEDTVDAERVFPEGRFYFGDQEQINESPFDTPLLSLERNGVNLLLVLEQSILYRAYAYSFFSQRSMWLPSVALSNWTGILHCLGVLESNLDFSYDRPSAIDISLTGKSLSSDALGEDPQDSDQPPAYTPESKDPTVIEAISISQREQALSDLERIPKHGFRWRELMEKILPTLPVLKSWDYKERNGRFEIILRRSVTATITGVGPNGIKLAKGANIRLGKVTKGFLTSNRITFSEGFQPKGSKGPIALNVTDIGFKWKKEKWYLESQGKSLQYAVAMDSIQELEWK